MTHDWTNEEQSEVMKFYGINVLDLEEWPEPLDTANTNSRLNSLSLSSILGGSASDDMVNSLSGDIATESTDRLLRQDWALFCLDAAQAGNDGPAALPPSMAFAKALLDEMKDPLGLNDSLYQMQVQRILNDPKYARLDDAIPGSEAMAIQLPGTSAPSLLLSSPNFDARLCLRLVHQSTSYEDLVSAQGHLEKALNLRREMLKSLVKQNFDRFVNAKNSIDTVYADIRAKGMNAGEYGMRPVSAAVGIALEKSRQVYYPLLKRRSQEESIRKRLAVFSEYRLIFNLPASLQRHAQLGEYQQCVYEYRKGKALFEAELPGSTLKPILERVWALHVEKAVNVLRLQLFEKLSSPVLPFDVQAKIVSYLTELEASPDPVAFYINAKLNLCLNSCQTFQDQTLSLLHANAAVPRSTQFDDQVVQLLRNVLRMLNARSPEKFTELSFPSVRAWKIADQAFKSLAAQLKMNLVPLARFVASPTVLGAKQRDLYAKTLDDGIKSLLNDFKLHIDSVLGISDGARQAENAAVAAFYAVRIAETMTLAFGAVYDSVPSFAGLAAVLFRGVKEMLAHLIDSILSRIWLSAVLDCRNLGSIESWPVISDGRSQGDALLPNSFGTALVQSFETFLVFLVTSTGQIKRLFYDLAVDDSGLATAPLANLEQWMTKAFVEFVIEGLYRYVRDDENSDGSDKDLASAAMADNLDLELIDGLDVNVDLLKLNLPARLLTVLSNVTYLKAKGLDHLVAVHIGEALYTVVSEESDSLRHMQTALSNVERAVSRSFIQSQLPRIVDAFGPGWLSAGSGTKVPADLRLDLSSSAYAALMALLDVQALICDVSPMLIRPLLEQLVHQLVCTVLKQIQSHAPVADVVGLLQAQVDLDFLQQRLVTLLTAEATAVFQEALLLLQTECTARPSLTARQIQDTLSQFYADYGSAYNNLFLSFQLA